MPERRSEGGDGKRSRRRGRRSWARCKHLGLTTTAAAVAVLVVGLVAVALTWDSGRPSFREQVAAASSAAQADAVASTPAASVATSAAPTATGSPPGGDPGPTVVLGRISAVGDSRWTLAGSNGLDYTIIVTSDTELPRRETFASFGVGDTVSVRGTLSLGTITAQRVVVLSDAASSPG